MGICLGIYPLQPALYARRLTLKGSMVAGEGEATEELGLCYRPENPQPGDPFIAIIETHLSGKSAIPSGEAVSVKGANEGEGVLDELPAGEVKWCLKSVSYEKALRLSFIKGDIQIQIFGPFKENGPGPNCKLASGSRAGCRTTKTTQTAHSPALSRQPPAC